MSKRTRNFFPIVETAIGLSVITLAAQADNLLVNGDFSAQNSGFTTGYGYIASGMSAQVGTYGIRTSSVDFNSGYTPFGDHTTGTGYMMLLDGAPSSGTVGWGETVTVQTNRTYYFQVWLASSDSANPSSIKLAINGVLVGPDVDLTTNAGVWESFTAVWDSGANTSAAITLSDDNTISFGNDFALDDLSFGTTNNATGTTGPTLSIYPAVEIDFVAQTNVTYQLQYATAANTNMWMNLGAPVSGNGMTNVVFDSTRFSPQRFYRVQTAP